METKAQILQGCEHDGSFIPVNEVEKAMDAHARNCMIEYVKWRLGYTDEQAGLEVHLFLKSDYFQELQIKQP